MPLPVEGNGPSTRQSIYSVITVLDLSFVILQAFKKIASSQAFSKKALEKNPSERRDHNPF